jgi:hypothetical protein
MTVVVFSFDELFSLSIAIYPRSPAQDLVVRWARF